nr:VPA1262 family N-terminal domain-containing protein [Pseudomonas sp. GGS8]
MPGVDPFTLKGGEDRLFFRRTLLSREDAISWYRSLDEGERSTPVPTRKKDRIKLDGVLIRVPRLEDAQPWPVFGLPIREELFSRPGQGTIEPAPFIGSVPGRIHRRFGDRAGLDVLLEDAGAQAFVARRMHIDLYDYQEYLGSAVYITPDPVVRQIDHFMVPAKNGRGERIIYRIVPRPGRSLEGVRVTAFDKEAWLLTSFETHQVPADGILEVEKGSCTGEYGFVVTHDREGVLAYQPTAPFLRQMNLSIRASSGNSRRVSVPSDASPDSPIMEYQAAMGSELASKSVIGEVRSPGVGARVAAETRRRERLADAKHYGQRWFAEGSRDEAAHFIRDLLRAARSRVMIADPYLGALQLGQFLYAIHGSEVSVTLLTTKLAFKPKPTETKLGLLEEFKRSLDDLNKHQQLSPEIRVISASRLHDRFLVVDDDVWFVGNSLNSLGGKASMIVKLPNPDEVIDRLQGLGCKAPSLDAFISSLSVADTGRGLA